MGTAPLRDRLINAAATAGLVVLGLSAIGCGSTASQSDSTTTTAVGPLTIWHNDFKTETVEGIASGLTTDNTTVTAAKVETAFEWKMVNGIAADSAPDVVILPSDLIPDHKDKLVTIPADYIKGSEADSSANTKEFFQNNFVDLLSSQLLNSDGSATAFPGPIKELKLFINRKLFGEASDRWRQSAGGSSSQYEGIRKTLTKPIATWNDFANASQLITQRSSNTIVTAGAALGLARNVEWAQDIYELMVAQQGGKIVDSTKMVALFQNYEKNAEGRLIYPGKDALRYFTSFSDVNSPNYSWSTDFGSARQAFLDGRVAMIFDYGEFADTVKQKAKNKVELEVADVPQVTADGEPSTFVRYYAIGISKGSTQKAKAGTLARLLSTENMNELIRGLEYSINPLKKSIDETAAARLAGATTVFKKHHTDFDAIMNEMLDDVTLNSQTADNAVDRAAERINQLLNQP